MRHPLRRYLILLFALLQCLGPLLHAHAHAGGHGGIHLHYESAIVHGDEAPVPVDVHAEDDFEVEIGLAPSLQPRPDGSDAMPGPIFHLPAILAQTGQWPKRAHSAILPAPPSYLIPFPGAPPTI